VLFEDVLKQLMLFIYFGRTEHVFSTLSINTTLFDVSISNVVLNTSMR
jgi:hypothetical protein